MTLQKIYGLIGYPVKHSLSPVMHNAAFRTLGIPAEYRLFEVKPQDLEDFLLKNITVKDIKGNSFSAQDIMGFNITIPHKVKAREILEGAFPFDRDAPLMLESLHYVKISGAINTVRKTNNKLEYFNTDASGFIKSLEKDLKFDTKNKNVLLIGCGGAGRAIIAALSWKQAQVKKIYINDIRNEAMEAAKKHFLQLPQGSYLKDKLEFISTEDVSKIIQDCNLLINATPMGVKETDPCVVDEKIIHKNLLVYDLIYNPKETKLLKISIRKGAQTSNGLSMLLYQGVDAFELWTEQRAPIEVMRQALNEAVSKL